MKQAAFVFILLVFFQSYSSQSRITLTSSSQEAKITKLNALIENINSVTKTKQNKWLLKLSRRKWQSDVELKLIEALLNSQADPYYHNEYCYQIPLGNSIYCANVELVNFFIFRGVSPALARTQQNELILADELITQLVTKARERCNELQILKSTTLNDFSDFQKKYEENLPWKATQIRVIDNIFRKYENQVEIEATSFGSVHCIPENIKHRYPKPFNVILKNKDGTILVPSNLQTAKLYYFSQKKLISSIRIMKNQAILELYIQIYLALHADKDETDATGTYINDMIQYLTRNLTCYCERLHQISAGIAALPTTVIADTEVLQIIPEDTSIADIYMEDEIDVDDLL